MSNTLRDKYKSIEDQENKIVSTLRGTNSQIDSLKQQVVGLESDILRIAGAKLILQQLIQEDDAKPSTEPVKVSAPLAVLPDLPAPEPAD